MAVFNRTVLVQNRAQAADAVFVEDLPVNPLSMVLLTIRGVTTESDTDSPLSDIYASIPSVGISFRGQDEIRGSLYDLAVLNTLLCGATPFGEVPQDGDGETFSLTVPLCFGRKPFDPVECFPAVRRGDLVLQVQVDTAVSNVDLEEVQIETVELLDVTPSRFLKYTTSRTTFASTGQEVVRLPIGNPLLGVLLWGTTAPTGTARTATWERLRTKVDNVETLYSATNWDTLHGELGRRLCGPTTFLLDHLHRANGGAAAFADTTLQLRSVQSLDPYAYLDMDPLRDGSYALQTAGRADVVIQRDSGTADAGRFLPVELVEIASSSNA